MTTPRAKDSPDELRQRWLNRYLAVQAKVDTKFRTALVAAAEDAYSQIVLLDNSTIFSSGVRAAQLRLVMHQVQLVHNELFKKFIPLIKDGQKQSASAAVTAFGDTDRQYLEAAFRQSAGATNVGVSAFIDGQREQAMLGISHTLSRIYKSSQPLSIRVYRTRSLANKWVQNQVNSGLLRGASAKEIALSVRSSIRPNVPGGVGYASLRLGRTEINNAFHATSITLAQDRPWVEGMDWHLSKTHIFEDRATPEVCETYAGQTFHVDHVPVKPHPQCRCFVAPVVEEMSVFLAHLTAGQYRDWIERNAKAA